MKSTAEVKIIGERYSDNYTCGLTMLGSGSMDGFKLEKETDEVAKYRREDGLVLEVTNRKSSLSEATEVITVVSNEGKEPLTMEMLTSVLLKGIKADKIHRFSSFWSAEGRHKVDTIKELDMEHSWSDHGYRVLKFGNLGSMPVRQFFPFVAVEDSETSTFTAVQLYAPSSWQIEVCVKSGDVVKIAGGLADRDFGHWTKKLMPGESYEAPKALVACGNSLLDVCDKLVKAQNPDISPVDEDMGIVFNEYCATWGNPTIDNLKKLADKIEGKGIKYLVMDSGWYGDCGNWWDWRGDWRINTKRFPNGLKELTDYIKSKGMIPGIWYELENTSQEAPSFYETEHLVKKDGVPLTVGNVHFLDMEDPWVIEHLDKYVIDNLKDNGFGYIKIDYNDTMGMGCDGPEGMGENLRKKVLATQEFFKRMKREIPELVIENCSSGGHRLEPSFMELSSMASFSDAHECLSLPIIAANVQRVIKPSQSQIWAVMRARDSDERIWYSICATFLGRMGLSGDVYDLSDHQWQLLDQGMAFYNKVSDIIKDGKTTVLEADTDSYNEPTGSQLVIRELGDKALVVYHRFADSVSLSEYGKNLGIDMERFKIIEKYGQADKDFSAMAILAEL
ncbi:glycoside hydrolase family 36 protein [Butyrivibrio sp. VCB2006]|uniref:glycoside hydrolase family 36 protein n=1 Tax=Butyrivibrio sp. VCB2006 TaxID=1280679 RepID=UPI0003F5D45C|nr:glycoside hydrolase family 36 protein [Butyrivibrio sp. VCB2006]